MESINMIGQYVNTLIKSDVHLLVVVGPSGIGKSSKVIDTLKEMGYQEGLHFIYETGYITPLAMFRSLAQVRMLEPPKLLIYDDVDGILKNKVSVGILKGALADVRGVRTVSYQSSTSREIKQHFEYDGKVILILNEVGKNSYIEPLLDRGIFYNIELRKGELEMHIENNLSSMYPTLNKEERDEVWNKIKIFTDLERFSFRTVKRAFAFYQNNKEGWYQLFKKSLNKSNGK